MTAVSDARGFLYAAPDGTVDADGKRFWNATDACCDLHATNVDDSTYISALIKEIPGAKTTVADWVTLDGCGSTADTSAPPLDLDTRRAGNETKVTKYGSGCKPGGHAELWTINGGGHLPSLSSTFSTSVVDSLFAHPKP